MANLRLRTRIRRHGDELVIEIPKHLRDGPVREGDEVSVSVRGARPTAARKTR